MKRIEWDQYFMAQSHLLATRSTCTRLMVGALIVRDRRIIAGGYNGSISGGVHCIDEGCYVIDGHCVRTIHAEMNALLQCAKFGVSTQNAELYVTHFPCLSCTKAIIQSGIRTVYYAANYRNHPYAEELLHAAGVLAEHVPLRVPIFTADDEEKKRELTKKVLRKLKKICPDDDEVLQLEYEAKKLFGTD